MYSPNYILYNLLLILYGLILNNEMLHKQTVHKITFEFNNWL